MERPILHMSAAALVIFAAVNVAPVNPGAIPTAAPQTVCGPSAVSPAEHRLQARGRSEPQMERGDAQLRRGRPAAEAPASVRAGESAWSVLPPR